MFFRDNSNSHLSNQWLLVTLSRWMQDNAEKAVETGMLSSLPTFLSLKELWKMEYDESMSFLQHVCVMFTELFFLTCYFLDTVTLQRVGD
jgi:hypothetical protein